MTFARTCALAGLGLLQLACAGGIELIDADAGRTVDLPVGQTLTITLEGLGSAGYVWEVASGAGTVLEQVGGRETLSPTSNAAGASARERFRFKGASPGETTLRLAQQRPFGSREVAKRFELTVRVR